MSPRNNMSNTRFMQLLDAFAKTSLIFWKDKNPLTLDQAITLFLSTAVFFMPARLPFAGGSTLPSLENIIIGLQMLVIFILVVTAGRLGRHEIWVPNLVRLITFYLVLVMIILSTSNLPFLDWIEEVSSKLDTISNLRITPDLHTDFKLYTASLSTFVSTLMLAWYSVKRHPKGWRILKCWSFYGSMCLTTIVTGFITYYSVIPR
uniref:Uncharacterized protein n=1 Tax=Candidatus Kentrum sp. LFY TaxID=2126342 RepID=A0A450U5G0_9GAMM|nr:MAG: hypothetical protein BECKLFY1418B_GA0070995_10036 [Candidatus Kentron sp. LFY]